MQTIPVYPSTLVAARDSLARAQDNLQHVEAFPSLFSALCEAIEILSSDAVLVSSLAGVGKQLADHLAILSTPVTQAVDDVLSSLRRAHEETDRIKGDLISVVSHELRTPLTAVLGYTELIEESAADGDLSALTADLAKIRRAAVRLLRTLSGILELSRLEAGDLRPAPRPIDLPTLVADVVEEAAALVAQHDDAVHVDVPAELPALVSDPHMLLHCLRSLLDNAIRFTAHGRVDIVARGHLVDDKPWLALSVQDTGVGIAPADLPRLFTAFGQLDDAPTRNVEGTGVSLALTHRFCALLGGRVEVASEPGVGSRFTLHLPGAAAPVEREVQR